MTYASLWVYDLVRPEDDTVTVLTSLLKQIKALGLSIRRLLLDRGFASIDVQEYLDQSGPAPSVRLRSPYYCCCGALGVKFESTEALFYVSC